MAPTFTTAHHRTAAPVHLRGVCRTFPTRTGERHVLTGIDLEIDAGEIVTLIGASGSGKSTLLRQICGLDTSGSGQILIGDEPVQGVDPRCAMAFQEPRLLPWRNLADNVSLGLAAGTPRAAGAERVAELFRTGQLPVVLPSVVSRLRLALAQAWLFLVAAELAGASMGMGFLLTDSQNNGRVDRVVLAIVLLALLGKLTDSVIGVAEKYLMRGWA